jgi:uncharacterized protein (DUF2147 family)
MVPLLLTAMLAAGAASPDAVVGTWRSPTKNGIIDIQKCGSTLCGRLVGGDDIKADPNFTDKKNKDEKLRSRPLKGITMLSGFKPGEDGVWQGGQVYNPNDGGTYSGKITVTDPNTLKLRGCIIWPACKTETWTRVR